MMLTGVLHAAGSALSGSVAAAEVPPLRLWHRDVETSNPGGFLEQAFFRGTGASEAAQATDALYMLIFWFSTFFFVVLMGLMVYWAIKYRRRPGVPPPISPSHNTLLELFWTIVPSSALLVIFFLGFWTYIDRQVASTDAYEITIKGKKWVWTPTYHNGASSQWYMTTDSRTNEVTRQVFTNTQESPVVIVPEGTRVRLTMSSEDVIHSFWIPDLRIKGDVFPNRYTGYTFETPTLEPGEPYQDHWIFCAEYCGDFHAEMAGILRVMPKAEFDRVLSTWSGPLTGPIVSQQKGCLVCHSIDGSAKAGPTWLNLYGSSGEFEDGSSIDFKDENYLRESILYPDVKHVKGYPGGMNVIQMTEQELDLMVTYIRELGVEGASEDGDAAASGAASGEEPADAPLTDEPDGSPVDDASVDGRLQDADGGDGTAAEPAAEPPAAQPEAEPGDGARGD